MTQPPFDGDEWDDEWWKRVRDGDPETSRDAAKSLDESQLRRIQRCVLALLRMRPMADAELIEEYRRIYGWAEESTVRTRRSELVRKGFVRDSGARWLRDNQRSLTIWEVVDEPID